MSKNLGYFFKYAFLITLSIFVLLPIWATVMGGFKTLGGLRVNPMGLPGEIHFEFYGEILRSPETWRYALNSLNISFFTVLLVLIFASMAAYTFSHIKYAGKDFLFSYLLLGLMFPAAAAIVPIFVINNSFLNLFNTHWAVILPQVAFGLGGSVLFFRGFFEQLPYELFEAARVDGIGYVGFYFRFILPLSLPILATVGVITLVNSWNNFLIPLIMLGTDPSVHPWPLGLVNFRGEWSTDWNKILAFISVNLAPAVAFFLLAQRYIVAGLTGGAVKG
ncbi:MAG: carbohydrate ABC transporter permease [Trueperaceae bacterium]|nr:carbohydrate ABC transporter permease [Trueperaceae bacterium]